MLMFLLKNGHLRLLVFFLVLVMGMELLPSAATLQCYDCLGEKCKTDYKTEKVTTCPPLGTTDRISCFSHISSTLASRNCEHVPFAKICAEEVYKRNCITAKEFTDLNFMTCTSKKASDTARQGGSDDVTPAPEPGVFCFCEGDLCNGGEEITKIVGGGGNPSPPNPNPTTGTGGDGTGGSGGGAPAPTDDKKSDNGTATGGPFSSFNTFGVLFFAVLGAFVSAGSVMVRP